MDDSTEAKNGTAVSLNPYVVVGVVAAVVSAATVAGVYYWRWRHLQPQLDSVQHLLDRCHTQVKAIEEKLGSVTETASTSVSV